MEKDVFCEWNENEQYEIGIAEGMKEVHLMKIKRLAKF